MSEAGQATSSSGDVARCQALESPSITVVCCIESGALETMTLRMIESLRRFGGRFSRVPVVAVTPRRGPALAGPTKARLRGLGVEHLALPGGGAYSWYHFLNKTNSLLAVEERAKTDSIAFIDSDVLFLTEPSELELKPGEEFAASAPDDGVVGMRGEGDPNEVFWNRCARLIGREANELPWIETGRGERIRLCWNAGVLCYSRATGLGRAWRDHVLRALAARPATHWLHVHFIEQVMLGLTVFSLGLDWRSIRPTSNYPVLSLFPQSYDPQLVGGVNVLHYHDSMSPAWWPKLLAALTSHPDVHAWLTPQGPVSDPSPVVYRPIREALRVYRGLWRRAYYARCGIRKGSTKIG